MKINFEKTNQSLIDAAVVVAEQLRNAGFEALFAGGCVRDAICGRSIKDIDIATSASPSAVEQLFEGRTVSVGKAFGVIIVLEQGFQFDVATFRGDGAYVNGRHPQTVCFCTAQEDAQRRDFTINALFYDPFRERVIDYVNGMADIKAGIIRAIGSAHERFAEDHLRMLRAIRFAAVLGFELDNEVWQAIQSGSSNIRRISVERITAEFTRMLCDAAQPSMALGLLRESGLLKQFLPEVESLYGVEQPPQFHPEGDVWTHTCMMLDAIEQPRELILVLSVLFHDIGKPSSFSCRIDAESGRRRIRFIGHAEKGGRMTIKIMERMKFSRQLIATVAQMVAYHMRFVSVEQMKKSTLRRLLGMEQIEVLLELNRLDSLCSNGDLSAWRFLVEKLEQFRNEPVLPPPLVTGKDLIGWGIKPGPELGHLLRIAYDAQLEGTVMSRDDIRDMLKLS